MSKVKIHCYETVAKNKLESVQSYTQRLQVIHDAIIKFGAVDLSIKEIESVVNAESDRDGFGCIREAILKDKVLQIAGLQIDPSSIKLPEQKIIALVREARKVDPGRNMQWRFYSVESGKLIVLPTAKESINESCTVYGSDKSKQVIEEVEKLCKQINKIGEALDANTYSPLRSPETWVEWNVDTKKYEPAIIRLATHVK
jgi:hypothetical protein